MMQGYIRNLPEFLRTTTQNIIPTEQAQLDAQRTMAPQQAELALDLAGRYMPQFTSLDSQLNRQRATQQAGTDLEIMRDYAPDLVRAQMDAARIADPEYYGARAQTGDTISRMFGALDDPNAGLSATERAEIERRTARDNNSRGITAPTATSAVESAMNFGAAGEQRKLQRQNAMNAAINTAAQSMPSLRSGIDAAQLTIGRPATPNMAMSQYGGVAPVGQSTYGMSQGFLGQMGENARQAFGANANRRTLFDTVTGVGNMLGNMMPDMSI